MLIFFWLLTILLFALTLLVLVSYFMKDASKSAGISAFFDGIRTSFIDCGFYMKDKKYPLELYKLEIVEDGDICDECLEKSSWPAMGITCWMEEGFPKSPDFLSSCNGHCRCKLIAQKKDQNSHINFKDN